MKIKLCMVFIVFVFNNAYAQQSITANELNHQIIALDKDLYSQTVACNKSEPPAIYDKSVEIYDGKNGLLSLTDLYNSKYFETCDKYKVEPTLESLAVYPLNNFGAILTGKQSHQKKQGASFKTTSTNQYIHVYKYEQNEWKISRVFTYDSIPVKSMSQRLKDEGLYNQIYELDKAVFGSFNTCDMELHKTFFTDDLEFYHDKVGLTSSLKSFIENTEKYVCGKGRAKMRRELVAGSLIVYPMNNYGAISIGEHRFYQSDLGQKERLTEVAKFVCVWKKVGDQWKMSRTLSYDHTSLE